MRFLIIEAYYVLTISQDTQLVKCARTLIFDQAGIVDTTLAQSKAEQRTCYIIPHDAQKDNFCIKRTQVSSSVCRSSWSTQFGGLAHNGNRPFATEPCGSSFKIGIEHGISDHECTKMPEATYQIRCCPHTFLLAGAILLLYVYRVESALSGYRVSCQVGGR